MGNKIEQLPDANNSGNQPQGDGEGQPSAPPKDTSKPLLEQDDFKCYTLENVLEKIRKVYEYAPMKKDPILMTVTIMQIFTEALDKLLKRHEDASLEVFARETGKLIGNEQDVSKKILDDMGKITGEFSKMMSTQSAKALEDAFAAHSGAMDKLDKAMEKTRTNIIYCAGATVGAVIVAAMLMMRFGG